MTDVVVLGAGPAGLGAALGLARRGYQVTVLEQSSHVGGNAGSFDLAGLRVDYGSHRFHPAADPSVLALVRELLGDDLLARPRHGRIRLLGRWIHFPLRAADLAIRAHPRFTAGVLFDLIRKVAAPSSRSQSGSDTFASVLERGLGPTICREFYFPYARKIWGLEPHEISPIQAYRRVSAGSGMTSSLPRLTRAKSLLSAWAMVEREFKDWAFSNGLGPVIVCPHAPFLLFLVALALIDYNLALTGRRPIFSIHGAMMEDGGTTTHVTLSREWTG